MREERIVVSPMDYLELLAYEGLLQVNEHGQVKLKGKIPYEKKRECMDVGKKQTWINVIIISGNHEYSLFCGLITSMRITVENETCIVELKLETGSVLLDKALRKKSFQNINTTYNDVLESCNQSYINNNCDKIMTIAKQKKIGSFLMQYEETDWDFIKRLAAREQTVVVPEYKTSGIKYYFGFPNRNEMISEGTCEYSMVYDMQEYDIKKAQGVNLSREDTISYVWEDREIYELGQHKEIDGRTMYIWKIETKLKKYELYHIYYMKPKQGICISPYYNQRLSGISLFATVLDIKEDSVQIQMEEDSIGGICDECWFSFATVYSSADGSGWYCMPEKGDRVRLNFPTHKEEDAYVVSAYHEQNAKLRKEPTIKFWRNKEGKEIQLTPEHILLTNNDGTYIELSDMTGIKIVSEGSVTIQAQKGMHISSAGGSIEMNASKKVCLQQGETKMNLSGGIKMQGARIKL